jgi:CheY-like chemotaxis protein
VAKDEKDRCLEAGMDDFLGKPLRPEILKQILGKWTRFPDPPAGEAAA